MRTKNKITLYNNLSVSQPFNWLLLSGSYYVIIMFIYNTWLVELGLGLSLAIREVLETFPGGWELKRGCRMCQNHVNRENKANSASSTGTGAELGNKRSARNFPGWVGIEKGVQDVSKSCKQRK